MDIDLLKAGLRKQLTVEEGERDTAYQDSRGLWTIGIGHHDSTICEGMCWSPDKIEQVFSDDVENAFSEVVEHFPWALTLNEPRMAVLIEMAFQMGLHTEEEFVTFLGLMRDERWPQAAGDILHTAWATQTPARVRRLSRQIETGEWQVAP